MFVCPMLALFIWDGWRLLFQLGLLGRQILGCGSPLFSRVTQHSETYTGAEMYGRAIVKVYHPLKSSIARCVCTEVDIKLFKPISKMISSRETYIYIFSKQNFDMHQDTCKLNPKYSQSIMTLKYTNR